MSGNETVSVRIHTELGNGQDYDFENIAPMYHVLDEDLETIRNGDERRRVDYTAVMPFKAICKLYMKAADGRNLIGTGWLTHSNKLYTAGHCVYCHARGGWMKSIIVVPGKAGTIEPYGRYTAEALLTLEPWIDDQSARYDMGAIKLSSSVNHDDFLSPTLSDADTVTLCGYPSDRDRGEYQYRMRDDVRKTDGRFFYYIDSHGGQSGAPLLRNNSIAIGIHNYGGCDNSGSDLYRGFIDYVERW